MLHGRFCLKESLEIIFCIFNNLPVVSLFCESGTFINFVPSSQCMYGSSFVLQIEGNIVDTYEKV